MIEQAFEVATEFHFDVGKAVIGSNQLQQAVQGISDSANAALSSLNFLATGLVTRLGLGSGGLLSIFSRALQLSEEFHTGTMGFVNSISSNFQYLSGHINGFNEQLETSQMLMDKVSAVSSKLGISAGQLAQITSMVATPLAARGKLGTNFANGIELAKNTMIGAEATGMHPMVAAESITRALSPGQGLMGKLFSRLVNTSAFREARVLHPQQLASMNQDKKIDLLSKAMGELGNNAEYLRARLGSIMVQFNMLKAQVDGFIKPIGDAIKVPLQKIFTKMIDFLQANGSTLGKTIGKIINEIVGDPEKFFVGLMQLKNLKKDFKSAFKMTEILGAVTFLQFILGKLGIVLNGGLIKRGFVFLFDTLMSFGSWLIRVIPWQALFVNSMRLLHGILIDVAAPLGIFLMIFQAISRARGIAAVADVKELAAMAPRTAAVMLRFKKAIGNILDPFQTVIDLWAQWLSPLFMSSTYLKIALPLLELLASGLEKVGTWTFYLMAGLDGVSNVIYEFLRKILAMKNPFGTAAKDFEAGVIDYYKENAARLGKGGVSLTSNQVMNVGKMENRFDLREQLEPDRVAFAVADHLKKIAANPKQARGNSLSSAFSGNQAFAGNR